jgi:anaphase-promoting complex subunit 3
MDIYSTVLWHLKKEADLSYLSQELISLNKTCPRAWIAVGNCFSLRKEHESSLKCFHRAIQLDPSFAYAYCLCGHEYSSNEALDKAQSYFRDAIRYNSRLYNAWYGLGMIYYQQEKWSLSEFHFRKALEINKFSAILHCYVGIVMHKTGRYDKAIKLDKQNPIAKYRKALCLVEQNKFMEALKELNAVIMLAPRESHVYFKIGQVYKHLGDTGNALKNYLIASDLNPKSNNIIKDGIEKLYDLDQTTVEDIFS